MLVKLSWFRISGFSMMSAVRNPPDSKSHRERILCTFETSSSSLYLEGHACDLALAVRSSGVRGMAY